jgi:hypothetical protein
MTNFLLVVIIILLIGMDHNNAQNLGKILENIRSLLYDILKELRNRK